MKVSMIVGQMVCPACARVHGQEHRDGCPLAAGCSDDYRDGWFAARDVLLPPLFDEMRVLEDRLLGAEVRLAKAKKAWEKYDAAALDYLLLGHGESPKPPPLQPMAPPTLEDFHGDG